MLWESHWTVLRLCHEKETVQKTNANIKWFYTSNETLFDSRRNNRSVKDFYSREQKKKSRSVMLWESPLWTAFANDSSCEP